MADDQSFNDINDKLKSVFSIIEMPRQQIDAYVKSLSIIGDQLMSLHADTKICKITVSVLLAEIAGKDRQKLDRLLALSVARIENAVDQLNQPAKSAMLLSIDELVMLAETSQDTVSN